MSNNVKIMANRQDIVAIADAVRSKTSTTQEMTLAGIASRINAISVSGGIELPELTNEGTASDMLSGKQLIDQEGNIVTGNIPNNGAIDKIFDGIDTKFATIPAGYTSGGTVSLTNDIDSEVDTQEDLISQITLALANKTAGSGSGGGITLPSLSNPATEDEVFLDQEYIDENGNKKTGAFTIESELTEQDTLINQLRTLVEEKSTFNTIYIGSSVPTNDIGVDGDFYIMRG